MVKGARATVELVDVEQLDEDVSAFGDWLDIDGAEGAGASLTSTTEYATLMISVETRVWVSSFVVTTTLGLSVITTVVTSVFIASFVVVAALPPSTGTME